MARIAKSGSASPTKTSPNSSAQRPNKKNDDYTSDGVVDHDVFLLPVSDYQIMMAVTLLATIVRLFRIYQPSSVVFDEVQYVIWFGDCSSCMLMTSVLVDLHPSTSKANSLWMFILPSRNY